MSEVIDIRGPDDFTLRCPGCGRQLRLNPAARRLMPEGGYTCRRCDEKMEEV